MPKPLTVWIITNWKIFQEIGIPDHLTCLLRNLYAGQETAVRTRHETTNWFQIGKWVCQCCSATTHFPFNSFLGWKHEKWFQEGKRLGGNLAGFRKNWITLLFPALQSETVSWNWVSAVSTQPQARSEAEETACLAMALLWDRTPRRRKGRPSKARCHHLRTMGEDSKAMWCWRQIRSSMN